MRFLIFLAISLSAVINGDKTVELDQTGRVITIKESGCEIGVNLENRIKEDKKTRLAELIKAQTEIIPCDVSTNVGGSFTEGGQSRFVVLRSNLDPEKGQFKILCNQEQVGLSKQVTLVGSYYSPKYVPPTSSNGHCKALASVRHKILQLLPNLNEV